MKQCRNIFYTTQMVQKESQKKPQTWVVEPKDGDGDHEPP